MLAVAVDLLGVQSTAGRPKLLRRALDTAIDFVGPGFHVERFDPNGKPSALVAVVGAVRGSVARKDAPQVIEGDATAGESHVFWGVLRCVAADGQAQPPLRRCAEDGVRGGRRIWQ